MPTLREDLQEELADRLASHGSDDPAVKMLQQQLAALELGTGSAQDLYLSQGLPADKPEPVKQ